MGVKSPMTKQTIFFDFFGTLVSYINHNADRNYAQSMAFLRSQGVRIEQPAFLDLLVETFVEHEQKAAIDHREYAWADCAAAVLQKMTGQPAHWDIADALTETYLREWCEDVSYIEGVREMLERLRETHDLALITNTHSTPMVEGLMVDMDIRRFFPTFVSSVDYGYRKPSPRIFQHAMDKAGTTPEHSLYVGDTYEADYVGATGAGMRCLLIDPQRAHDIDSAHRIDSILGLETAVGSLS
jgi:putative hydrolase of the HAD superfamily